MAQEVKPGTLEEFMQGVSDAVNEAVQNLKQSINQAVTSYRDYIIARIQDLSNFILGVLDRLENKRSSMLLKISDLGLSYGETSVKSAGSIELSITTLASLK